MNALIYLDYSSNKIVVREIDKLELEEEFENDISAYADAYAPSNLFEWMLIDDKTEIEIDESIIKEIMKTLLEEAINEKTNN